MQKVVEQMRPLREEPTLEVEETPERAQETGVGCVPRVNPAGMTPYEIRVQGHLSPQRFRGFEGLTVHHQPNGETVLFGSFPD
jgi:hypothetical protein